MNSTSERHLKFTCMCPSLSWSLFYCFCCWLLLLFNKSLTSFYNSLNVSHSLWVSFVASNSSVLSVLLLGYLRPTDNHPSDHHSSSQALHLQCQPLYRPASGPHLTPNRLHQQTSWSSTNHSHCAGHPPVTPPSSRLGAPCLWGQAGPWCPVALHSERRNSRPPMSQRISRWGLLHVHFFHSTKQTWVFHVEAYSHGLSSMHVGVCACNISLSMCPSDQHVCALTLVFFHCCLLLSLRWSHQQAQSQRTCRWKPVLHKWKAHLPQKQSWLKVANNEMKG